MSINIDARVLMGEAKFFESYSRFNDKLNRFKAVPPP
jgi:hypothetical protein